MSWVEDERRKRREMLERLEIADASLWLGPPEGFPLARGFCPRELAAETASQGIKGGLVSHWWGKTLSPQAGNRALIEAAPLLTPPLYAVWTGVPLDPPDVGPLPGFGRPDAGMKGVRLFPRSHAFILEDWVVGSLCEWLIRYKLPLFLWHTEIDWRELHSLAQRYPRLLIVLETQVKKIIYHTRVLFPLLRECPNVIVETSNFVGPGYIEHAVREFGASRLVFGSFLPVNDPTVPIGMILDADISDGDKLRIASGNLAAIVEGSLS